jgi:hypothetical protein
MDSDFHLAVRPHLSAMPTLGFQSNGRGRVRRSISMLRKRGDGHIVGYDVHLIKKDAVAHSVLVVGLVFVALLLML